MSLTSPFTTGTAVTKTQLDALVNAINALPQVASGFVNITIAVAGTPVSQTVTFPSGLFTANPQVVCNVVNTSTPQNRSAAPSGISTTGCTVFGWSSGTGTIVVHWIAVN